MSTYKVFDFLMTGDIFTDDNYPIEEYQKYLEPFLVISFNFDGIIQSLHFDLTMQSINRICNGYAYDKSYDEIISTGNEKFPRPIAFLTLTLWSNGAPEIVVYKNTLPL